MKSVRKWIHETILPKNFWCGNFIFHCSQSYLPTYIAIVRSTTSYVYRMKKWNMPDFSCGVVITSFTPRGSVIVMRLQKSDIIRLMPFSSKNLFEVAIKTLILIYLKYFPYRCLKYLLFECSLKKGNILNSPFPQVWALFFLLQSL